MHKNTQIQRQTKWLWRDIWTVNRKCYYHKFIFLCVSMCVNKQIILGDMELIRWIIYRCMYVALITLIRQQSCLIVQLFACLIKFVHQIDESTENIQDSENEYIWCNWRIIKYISWTSDGITHVINVSLLFST